MSHGYAVTNLISSLAATAFTWSSAYATGRDRLNDDVMDELAAGSSSAQASGQTLTVDLGSAQSVSAVALLNHNLASGACTVAVTYADDSGFTVGTGTAKAASTVPTSAPSNKDMVLQFPAVSKRYWRLTFAHSGTKIVTLGELLVLSSLVGLSRTSIYGGTGESERCITNRVEGGAGGTRSSFVAGPIRTRTFGFKDAVGTSQRDELMSMWRATRGGTLNLLWVETIESTATAATDAGMDCLWGRLSEEHAWQQPDFELFDVDGFSLTNQGREVGS